MPLSVLISALASAVLLPPANAMLLCLAGWLLRHRLRRTSKLLMGSGLVLLLVLSTRLGALLLVVPLEEMYPPLASPGDAQAIVILGAGRISFAPEYGGRDQPSLYGLKRIEYGAYLQRQTGLPILVTGGSPDGSPDSEASLMARSLRDDFHVPVRWEEGASNTTWDNARLSAPILKEAGITRVLLVTDAIHMPRAMDAFREAGLTPTAAATLFSGRGRGNALDLLPGGASIMLSSYALREWIGRLWYQVRH